MGRTPEPFNWDWGRAKTSIGPARCKEHHLEGALRLPDCRLRHCRASGRVLWVSELRLWGSSARNKQNEHHTDRAGQKTSHPVL